MADRAIFLGWTRAVSGREKQALEVFAKAHEYFTKLQGEGKIESFESVLLQAHGGDLNGFTLVRGEGEKLQAVKREERFMELAIEANYCVLGYGIIDCVIGEGITQGLSRLTKIIGA
jgi:hypothetical protein